MSDTPAAATPVVVIDKSPNAIIARVHVKLLDDKELKLLSQLIDQSAAEPGVSIVVIDLSQVQILPSIGLGALVQISNKCKARDQALKIAAAQPAIRRVFAITRLDRILDLTDSVDAALQ
jgi:anti-anti-sigma factor